MPTDTDKVRAGKLTLASMPDWVKIAVFLLGTFAAGGGGATFAGQDYTEEFKQLDSQMQKLTDASSNNRERLIRLEVEMENLKKVK